MFTIIREVVLPPDATEKGLVGTREVYKNGEEVRERLNDTTGVMNFHQRRELAKHLGGKPVDAKKPKYQAIASKDLYTPATDKFDGYTHFPRPVAKPYANKIDPKSQVSALLYGPKQKRSLSMYRKIDDLRPPAEEEALSGLPQTPKCKPFIYQSLREPDRVHETKIKKQHLSQTVTDFKKKYSFEPNSARSSGARSIFRQKPANHFPDHRREVISELDRLTGQRERALLA